MNSSESLQYSSESFVKDSDVPWIGMIPDDWDVQPLKRVISCMDGKRVPIDASARTSGPYPYWGAGNIVDYIDQYLFDEELVLLGEDGAPFFDKTRPVAFHINEKVWVNNHIHVLKAKGIDPSYLTFVLNSVDYHEYISGSILPKLTQSDMNSILIPVPPINDQKKIATYISSKCEKIDSIVDSQNELISKLSCLKQSIISETVTKGLDSDVPMKDSEIQWIGQIPENWDIVSIKSRFKINKRIAGKLGFDVLSVTQDGVKIKDISSNDGQLSSDYSKYQLVYKGDFVMNHMDLLTGFVDCSPYDGVTSPDYRVFTLESDDLHRRYALYILQMGYRNRIFYGMGQGVSSLGRWRLPKEQFLNFEFPLPPLDVQESIVSYLDSKCKVINSLISDYSESINRLDEFKQSLVYEYVTSKKSVPEEAIL